MTTCSTVLLRTQMIGVVLPVRNEEELLGSALDSLALAVGRIAGGIPCHVVLVFDSCSDRSVEVGRRWAHQLPPASGMDHRVSVLEISAGNVGCARRMGCAAVLGSLGGIDPGNLWLATSDADSKVPRDWLLAQLASHETGVEIWSGSVTVLDWTFRKNGTAAEWQRQYESECDPAHGASLGINGQTYLDAGGFKDVASGEDRLLLDSAIGGGAACSYDRSVPVITSARQDSRAPSGFAAALGRVECGLRDSDGIRSCPDLDRIPDTGPDPSDVVDGYWLPC